MICSGGKVSYVLEVCALHLGRQTCRYVTRNVEGYKTYFFTSLDEALVGICKVS
jgi:hypothetical protein